MDVVNLLDYKVCNSRALFYLLILLNRETSIRYLWMKITAELN
jgi:hypothetical protein